MYRPSSRVSLVCALAVWSAGWFGPVPVSAANNFKDAAREAAKPGTAATAKPTTQGGAAPEAATLSAGEVAVEQQPPSPGGLLVPGSDFRYDPTGRRDPFKSLLQLENKQRDISQLPPIQQFDVETAKVVGIVIDPARGAQAMIRAPSGQTFVVRQGTIMGKNEGEVIEITLQGIRIVEKFLDFMNRETRKETFLKSHPAAGK